MFWRDHKALEQARTNPLWREQIKRFEAGKYYKSIPLELVCESVESFSATLAKPKKASKPAKARKTLKSEEPEAEVAQPEESQPEESAAGRGIPGSRYRTDGGRRVGKRIVLEVRGPKPKSGFKFLGFGLADLGLRTRICLLLPY